jgi:protein-disulfide isomerase
MNRSEVKHLTLPVGDRDHAQGDADAPVTLVEYGDYQCPFCGQAHPIVKAVQNHFGPRLRFVFRNFPLSEIHPHAAQAAAAAEAAAERGKFWEMHDHLFTHQSRLAERDLVSYASELGIESNRFLERMESAETAKRVEEDFMSGVRSGVNGTPTFFINNARYDGPWDYTDLVSAIEASMQRGAVETTARR